MLKSALMLLAGLSVLFATSSLSAQPQDMPNGPAAQPQVAMSMVINGIPGAVDVTRYRIGATSVVSSPGGGGGAGRATFQDLTFSKPPDGSSPTLLLWVANGRHINEVVLTVNYQDRRRMRYRLRDVTITGFIQSTPKEGAAPAEDITLHYERIDFEFWDGRLLSSMSWDTSSNTE